MGKADRNIDVIYPEGPSGRSRIGVDIIHYRGERRGTRGGARSILNYLCYITTQECMGEDSEEAHQESNSGQGWHASTLTTEPDGGSGSNHARKAVVIIKSQEFEYTMPILNWICFYN